MQLGSRSLLAVPWSTWGAPCVTSTAKCYLVCYACMILQGKHDGNTQDSKGTLEQSEATT